MDLETQILQAIQEVSSGTETYDVNDSAMVDLMYKEIEKWSKEKLLSSRVSEEFKKLPQNKVRSSEN